ncbi:MAG: hypothetical protein E6J38_06420 [Chloroflexi bacterium]|nr:MAG: hypothetical protein E6J38_06420 [Chloroflexota bacterium]
MGALDGVEPCEVERVHARGRRVAREEPRRVTVVRAEFEDRPWLEQGGERTQDERGSTDHRPLHAHLIDAGDARDVDVRHARRRESLELDPHALGKLAAQSARIRHRVGQRAPQDRRQDVPIADTADASPLRRGSRVRGGTHRYTHVRIEA